MEKLPSDDKKAQKIALQSSNFTIEDEVLYFLDSKHKHRKRAVVPSHLRERVMKEVHGGPFSGHFSGNRFYNVLARVWWWEGMYKDAVDHSRSCPNCAIVVGRGCPLRPIKDWDQLDLPFNDDFWHVFSNHRHGTPTTYGYHKNQHPLMWRLEAFPSPPT